MDTPATKRPDRSEPTAARGELSTRGGWIGIGAVASIGAGAIHAAAASQHADQRGAAWAFALAAVLQIGSGAFALARPRLMSALALGAVNGGLLAGWVIITTVGIGAIDGFGSGAVDFPDALAAALAAVAVAGTLASTLRLGGGARANGGAVAISGLVVALVAVPGLLAVGDHTHGDGDGHGHAEAVVPPEPYDATLPVNLGGVPGVSPEEQARAEELVETTLERLPQFADASMVHEHGYFSIGDALTGYEHFVNWAYVENGVVLDADRPESLVYRVEDDERTLVAAMYMLPTGTTLDDVPDVGGMLTQWHVHNDLCFTDDPVAPVLALEAGVVVDSEEECRPPASKRGNVPMIHVWIVPHPCGPFSALEGIGGGQVAEGETHFCNHAHGDDGGFF